MIGIAANALFIFAGILAAGIIAANALRYRNVVAHLRAAMAADQMPRELRIVVKSLEVTSIRMRGEGPAIGVVRVPCRYQPARPTALPVAA